MNTLLAIYIAVFTLFHLIIFSVEVFWTPPSERDPVLESVIDGLIATILLVGMIFFYTDAESHKLKVIWAFLAPTGCAVQL